MGGAYLVILEAEVPVHYPGAWPEHADMVATHRFCDKKSQKKQ